MPAIAWSLLKGQRDTSANFWFAGTACYAGTASLFVLQTVIPSTINALLGLALVVSMLLLLVESLRRELWAGPTPWVWMVALVVGNCSAMALITWQFGLEPMRVAQLLVVTLLDLVCCALLVRVIRVRRSRALAFVLVGFLAVILTNFARILGYLRGGESTLLLSFTPTANVAFIANYLSVVLYSFGYWGFVIEKNRSKLLQEIAERERAQASELQARTRELTSQELLVEREELIAQLTRMQRAVQAGALSASITHEVNQPLTSVRLSVEEALVLHGQLEHQSRVGQLLQRIAQENRRASATIQTLRNMFLGRQSAAENRPLDEVVKAMCDQLSRRIGQQGVELLSELNAPVRVEIGAGELEHVVLNLLTNALDALKREATPQPQIRVSTQVHNQDVLLRVADNGPGILLADRQRLFDLFSGSNPAGMGLGLWLSRYIVERRGGQLLLDDDQESTDRAGAAFTVRLPHAGPTPPEEYPAIGG